jgi:hypothetical protein
MTAHRAVSIETEASRELARGARARVLDLRSYEVRALPDRDTIADLWNDLSSPGRRPRTTGWMPGSARACSGMCTGKQSAGRRGEAESGAACAELRRRIGFDGRVNAHSGVVLRRAGRNLEPSRRLATNWLPTDPNHPAPSGRYRGPLTRVLVGLGRLGSPWFAARRHS